MVVSLVLAERAVRGRGVMRGRTSEGSLVTGEQNRTLQKVEGVE